MTPAIDRIIDALRDATGLVRQSGGQWQARCPAHEDRNPSLSVRPIEGSVLLHCHAGCDTLDVLAAINMTPRDLYDEPSGNELARYQYTDATGRPTRTVHRLDGKRFTQSGDKRVCQLYRLPKVVEAVTFGRTIYLVEGEKDVHAIESLGEVATTGPQGAENFGKVDVSPLKGARVVAIVDRDAAGEKWAALVRQRLAGYAAELTLVEAAEGKDAADHIASGRTLAELVERPEPDPAGQWDDPLPLGWQADLPPFPIDALPPTLARFVRGLALEVQTPADLPGSVVLGILAACVGGRVVVVVRRGWHEPTNLFVVPVMPPGSRKSAVIAVCRRPLTEAEMALAERVAQVIIDRRTEREIREQYADAAKRVAAKDGDPVKIMEAQEAVRAAEQVTVPSWPRLSASDATPEALITLLANQGGRIAAISAEAGIFTALTGRYSKTPNLDPILMAHAGDAILVDRRGREPERVDAPALTLVASIQPFALREMVERPDFGGRGVLARILWALPVDNTGHRDVEPPEMPERDREAYQALIYDLALSMAERDAPALVVLSEAARKVHLEYHRTVERRLRRGGELGADLVREWGSKLAGAVARIAGCLHAASAPLGDPISEATMRAAVELGDYYQAHAVAALAPGGDDKETSNARLLLAWLIDRGLTRFKLRDLQRTGPKSLRKAPDARPVLDDLTEKGWIREHQDGGWEVHPHAGRLLKAGDTGDRGDNPSVSAGQSLPHPVAPAVAPAGDTGDNIAPDAWSVARVAPAGDNPGDTSPHPLSSGNAELVAPVAPVAPLWPDTDDTCPSCRWPLDSSAHYQNCEATR
ncbi:DUF3987 domain-containing protein [Micromonospora terminaliae]|uniref:DUF3987 domain-containing protein n=1 Tax=Micromonospora terminaliae TaxID=1914461 RepID=A0AAJ3DM87_9ACTN|nr:DUF3987 domain-containing protein [Micromonospora terminaliae]NES28955.1 DUF3987 domain-containing protein [Micromonospora terminaliae]